MPISNDDVMTLTLILGDLLTDDDILEISHHYHSMLNLKHASIIMHMFSKLSGRRINYHCRVLHQVVAIRSAIKKKLARVCANIKSEEKPVFLVRVDDFPRWDMNSNHFLQFHDVLATSGIPYLLGVIPYPSRDPLNPRSRDCMGISKDDLGVLDRLRSSKVEFAMHGITHQTINAFRNTEIIGLDLESLEAEVSRGLKELQRVSKVDIFIPAFNSFDLRSMKILRKYFKIVCGGPESVLHVGLRLSPSFLNGVLYVPSYYPAYGRAKEMLEFVERAKEVREPLVIPLTLHWRWEADNAFADVEQLCEILSDRVVPWRTLETQLAC